jgi:hypothetical protein
VHGSGGSKNVLYLFDIKLRNKRVVLGHRSQAKRPIPQHWLGARVCPFSTAGRNLAQVNARGVLEGMRQDPGKLREQAEHVRWWASSVSDPLDRERMRAVARDYEEMARSVERDYPIELPID